MTPLSQDHCGNKSKNTVRYRDVLLSVKILRPSLTITFCDAGGAPSGTSEINRGQHGTAGAPSANIKMFNTSGMNRESPGHTGNNRRGTGNNRGSTVAPPA
ncbi:hypothetical protein DPMN_169437 [Dreissena polymorpha]|uniref:Uncharacterized protein n=1 Tax=Dreissena polymorpha TaxID=45954 RepID=A0A9D4DXD9_DREPO|nr:hypothetical protein DPMN_169437 [Dreissena polymorpha]